MDSLGGKHPAAIKRLQRYLRLEAEDKRKVSKTSEALGKQAIVRLLQMNYRWSINISPQVPVQPNFCDCGLFLLHFAETFVNDPAKYCRIITVT
jgi:Ulp1 family protease